MYFELERRDAIELTDQVALLISSDNLNYKSTEPAFTSTIQQNATGKDYKALQSYAKAQETYSNLEKSFTYDYAKTLERSEVLSEEIYSDPGLSEADIYACFERKKFHIIKNRDIRYVIKYPSCVDRTIL